MTHIRFDHIRYAAFAALFAVGTPSLSAQTVGDRPASAPRQPALSATRRIMIREVDVTTLGYDVGSPTAPVIVVNFSDFGCPYCASFSRETYPELEREFIRTGKVLYKYVPFAIGMFPNGKQAARASECAAEQGKFWPMHERLYARQRDWKRTAKAFPVFREEAERLGIDGAKFADCYESHRTDRRTEGATILSQRLGIRATPTFFVNGHAVEGALPLQQFRELLQVKIREGSR